MLEIFLILPHFKKKNEFFIISESQDIENNLKNSNIFVDKSKIMPCETTHIKGSQKSATPLPWPYPPGKIHFPAGSYESFQ